MINGGIYAYNFQGKTNAEFQDTHPAIVIQNNKQIELYYVIPITTYTEERWRKYKKRNACRLLSINSIALLHQMQVVHSKYIGKRYYSNDAPLMITDKEFDKVCDNLLVLINKSISVVKKDNVQYHSQLNTFEQALKTFAETKSIEEDDLFTINQDDTVLVYKTKIPKSYWQDYEYIVKKIIPEANIEIADDKSLNIFIKI